MKNGSSDAPQLEIRKCRPGLGIHFYVCTVLPPYHSIFQNSIY